MWHCADTDANDRGIAIALFHLSEVSLINVCLLQCIIRLTVVGAKITKHLCMFNRPG